MHKIDADATIENHSWKNENKIFFVITIQISLMYITIKKYLNQRLENLVSSDGTRNDIHSLRH